MGRRKPRTRRISGAAKRRKRRERLVDSAEKKRSNSAMDGKRRLMSVIVCSDGSLEALQGENVDICKASGISLADRSRECAPHIDDDNGLHGSRGARRSREGDRYCDVSRTAERARGKRRRHSLDYSFSCGGQSSRHDRRLSLKDRLCSEQKDARSSDLWERRRRNEKRLDSRASACKVTLESSLEKGSTFELLNDNSVVPVVAKQPCATKEHALEIPKVIRSCARKKLLVLDLNGLLCDVVHGHPPTHRPHGRVGRSAVFKRPFCDDFLEFCCEKFDIGVWSSRKIENVLGVVDFIMKDIRDKLLFCWDASKCTYTGFKTIENRNKPLVLKQLKKLWEKEEDNLPWEKGDYLPPNTLLLDDSPYKALCNPPYTGVFPYPYSYTDDNDKSLGPGGDLRIYLEGLALADDVQCYVRDHPFGRRAITSSNPSWKYYEQIVKMIM